MSKHAVSNSASRQSSRFVACSELSAESAALADHTASKPAMSAGMSESRPKSVKSQGTLAALVVQCLDIGFRSLESCRGR